MENAILDDFEESNIDNSTPDPPTLPSWKFVLLTSLSLGLYLIYWFYKFWAYVRDKENSDIKPVWRALFGGIFSFALVDKIAAYANETGVPHRLNSLFVGITFLVVSLASNILSNTPEYSLVLFFLSLLLFVQPLNVLNAYSIQIGKPIKVSFSGGQIAIVIIGSLLFVLIVLGLSSRP